ncbi:hypothetical protein D3C87_1241590 [compost metagenome]
MKNSLLILAAAIAEKDVQKVQDFLEDIADNSAWNVFVSSWKDVPTRDKLNTLRDMVRLLRDTHALNRKTVSFEVIADLLDTAIKTKRRVGPIWTLLEKLVNQSVYSKDQNFDAFFEYEVKAYTGIFKRELNLHHIQKKLTDRKMTVAIKRPMQPLLKKVDTEKPIAVEGPILIVAKYYDGNQVTSIRKEEDDDSREITFIQFIDEKESEKHFCNLPIGLEIMLSVLESIKSSSAYWIISPIDSHKHTKSQRDPNSKYGPSLEDFCLDFKGLFESLGIGKIEKRGLGFSDDHPSAKLNPTMTLVLMDEDEFSES